MPDSKPDLTRYYWVKTRVNGVERSRYRAMAKAENMRLSDLIRMKMDQPTVGRRRLKVERPNPALVRQLAAMGNNLNQLARAVNKHGLRPDDASMVLTYLAGIQDELRQLRHGSKPQAPELAKPEADDAP